jgi:D-beta-D-heptose 7-phosphate kinase/D-beta-D-heptose 1-phosphate adenosyltransferase
LIGIKRSNTARPEQERKDIMDTPYEIGNKVMALEDLVKIRRDLSKLGRKVVFSNGCFDILHAGHIHLFRLAKRYGDILIVAVNDDESVTRLKGTHRPVFPLEERLEVLAAISDIDFLVSFSEETPQVVIQALLPDVLVKGGDWQPEEVVGKAEVEAAGGRVMIAPYLPGKSTSAILDAIQSLADSDQ